MNLKRLKTFMLVIEHKNFSTVAEILNISQPGVSKQIKTLEKELGTSLLHRDSLIPTEAGRIVCKRGKSLLCSWKQLEEECQAFQTSLTGLVKIGASSIPSTYILPPILRNYLNAYPQLEISLSVHESDEVLELIQTEKLDLGFVGCQPQSTELMSYLIAEDKLLLIGPNDSEKVDSYEDIKDLPFIFRSGRSGTWKAAKKGLLQWGGAIEELNCIATVHSTESVITMVESGLGYSIVSDMAASLATKYNRIKILAELPVDRKFYCVYSTYKQQQPGIKAFIDLLRV
ncbi:selenium metabolism-associated LysR family transcriptional regulator [Alkalihalobacillus sp. BA299]|uniref:selenium metabolism-associated LysR family transcriptional regulator n=1 Tax=Alkalihalobacillus sp. BA299 TaxID=2815938 RepID=UPI001ADB0391|nr:selenium metabolism-associated LysR family transcriptional regulator [Alkalihalobacillus sp. BA299]